MTERTEQEIADAVADKLMYGDDPFAEAVARYRMECAQIDAELDMKIEAAKIEAEAYARAKE
jgi:hypothetical protein